MKNYLILPLLALVGVELGAGEVWDKQVVTEGWLSLTAVAADYDGHGACCGFESGQVSVYLNDGKGAFSWLHLGEEKESDDLRAVDMGGDGGTDLIDAGRRAGNVERYENFLK